MVIPIPGDTNRVAGVDSVQLSAGLVSFSDAWVVAQSYLKRGCVGGQPYGKTPPRQAAMVFEP